MVNISANHLKKIPLPAGMESACHAGSACIAFIAPSAKLSPLDKSAPTLFQTLNSLEVSDSWAPAGSYKAHRQRLQIRTPSGPCRVKDRVLIHFFPVI
jgi:hypothetical protein